TLEQLRDNDFSLELRGPSGKQATISCSFFLKDAEPAFFSKQMALVTLPIGPETLKFSFFRWVQQEPELKHAFSIAHSCKVEINTGPGSSQSFICERAHTAPLTWKLNRSDRL